VSCAPGARGPWRATETLALSVSVPVVVQFIIDYIGRHNAGELVIKLPVVVDQQLVDTGFTAAIGPLKMPTIKNRLYML